MPDEFQDIALHFAPHSEIEDLVSICPALSPATVTLQTETVECIEIITLRQNTYQFTVDSSKEVLPPVNIFLT